MSRHETRSLNERLVCDVPTVIDGENYAVMGGLLGGLFLVVVYIILMSAIDACYNRKHSRDEVSPRAPSPHTHPDAYMHAQTYARQALWPEHGVSPMRQSSMASGAGDANYSPRSFAQRRVRFDTDVDQGMVNNLGSHPRGTSQGERHQHEQQRQEQTAAGQSSEVDDERRGSDGQQWRYTRGGFLHGETDSPSPVVPPR
ncbi:hypothetical protein DQ04_06431050 [Trypanosoma grayi]|uniref:hypothetical protein n=1 Tax=Trypanosoma grayi TaxID=71804 RepID=UPI0004F43B1F|nr:hypothetical protein DQ04_06431050 [Trypanosoma grayi]KEG08801.1 hypothetical protein DQ04_06431050 [Trypanosoma grayi]